MKILSVVVCLLCFGLGSCALYTKPAVPRVNYPGHFKYMLTKITHADLHYNWWENFADAQLNTLVNVAIKNNVNYKIALKNIDIAKTYISQNASGFFPQVNVNFNASRERSASASSAVNFSANKELSAFATVSYELDVWNQISNSLKQAKANVASIRAHSEVVKLTLISELVNTYLQITFLNADLENYTRQYQVLSEIFSVLQTQYRSGLLDIAVLNAARTQVESIKINRQNVEKQKAILVNALVYLLGTLPENFSFDVGSETRRFYKSNLVPAGIPAKIVGNRPDVQSAYFQVLSYGYLQKQTIANFLPTFNLTGAYGYAAKSFSRLFIASNGYWNYGLKVLQPAFDYKLKASAYKRANYQYEAAILLYKNTIITAFQEINNALISYQRDNEALRSYQRAAANAQETLNAVHAQYKAGYGDYLSYLHAKWVFLQNEYNLLNQRLLLLQDVVQVYKTMGLGL